MLQIGPPHLVLRGGASVMSRTKAWPSYNMATPHSSDDEQMFTKLHKLRLQQENEEKASGKGRAEFRYNYATDSQVELPHATNDLYEDGNTAAPTPPFYGIDPIAASALIQQQQQCMMMQQSFSPLVDFTGVPIPPGSYQEYEAKYVLEQIAQQTDQMQLLRLQRELEAEAQAVAELQKMQHRTTRQPSRLSGLIQDPLMMWNAGTVPTSTDYSTSFAYNVDKHAKEHGKSSVCPRLPRERQRMNDLVISDDEEEDESGTSNSLPVSINKDVLLGQGAFSLVYEGSVVKEKKEGEEEEEEEYEEAFEEPFERKVAIKAINISNHAKYPALRKMMENEVAALRMCIGFPAVIQFEGFTESPGTHAFVVMERLDCNLFQYVIAHEIQRLQESMAKVVTRQILAALHFLHNRGIVHGDIKPQNIMVADRSSYIPHVKLTDFGHVRFIGDDWTENSLAKATANNGLPISPGYRGPEAPTTIGYSPSLDVYGLGGTTYFMLTGREPIDTIASGNDPSKSTLAAFKQHLMQQQQQETKHALELQEKLKKEREAQHQQNGVKKGKTPKKGPRTPPEPKPPTTMEVPSTLLAGNSTTHSSLSDEEPFTALIYESLALWQYISQSGFTFCQQLMWRNPLQRLNVSGAMNHEWMGGFEMYVMLRKLETRIGLIRPCDRHLTTVQDDVNYQRAMSLMNNQPEAYTVKNFSYTVPAP